MPTGGEALGIRGVMSSAHAASVLVLRSLRLGGSGRVRVCTTGRIKNVCEAVDLGSVFSDLIHVAGKDFATFCHG
jgi:hypothetical protein